MHAMWRPWAFVKNFTHYLFRSEGSELSLFLPLRPMGRRGVLSVLSESEDNLT